MEHGLYAQVVMIRQKESDNKKKEENNKKYKFQGQSERYRRWFDLDHDWIEENFMIYESDFYKNHQT